MQITVRGHKLKVTPAIRNYANKKLQRLERFFDNIKEIIVELEVQKIKNKAQRQSVHVTIDLAQGIIRANESDIDIYMALDKVFDKLEMQVKKHHEKLKTRRFATSPRRLLSFFSQKKSPVSGAAVVVAKKVPAGNPIKPMDTSEALLEYSMDKHDFFVFKNPRNNTMNVLEGKKGGTFSLYHTAPAVKKGLFNKLFGGKEDPACGEKAVVDVVALGKIYRSSADEALAVMQKNNWPYYFYLNDATKCIDCLYTLPQSKFGVLETNF